jgi:abhydrolase domain-containing protein 6
VCATWDWMALSIDWRPIESFGKRLEHAVGKTQYRAAMRLARRLAGFEESVADLGGMKIPFFIRGWGPPLVLLHGFGGDKESWLMMARELGSRHTLIVPDLPGHGAADRIEPHMGTPLPQAKMVIRLLERLGFARAHYAGSSMGGGIALRLARDFPERVSSLTLIGSMGPVVEKSEVAEAVARGENPLVLTSPSERDFDRLLSVLLERRPVATRAMPRAMRRYLGEDKFARSPALQALFQYWLDSAPASETVPEDLDAIQSPTLVVHGELDRVIHPATGRALAARIPDARLEILRGIGHVPQMEAPKETARLVDSFVDGIDGRLAEAC